MDYGRAKVISEKIENILNEQINKEFYSAYLYLAISAHFDEIGLKGFQTGPAFRHGKRSITG